MDDKYVINKNNKLGEGTFGVVYGGTIRGTSDQIAGLVILFFFFINVVVIVFCCFENKKSEEDSYDGQKRGSLLYSVARNWNLARDQTPKHRQSTL